MGSYVGIDLHRRRSVVVVLNEDGDRVSWCRIDNTPANLAAEIVAAGGPEAEVAMEATWGWYWAADVIAECGARLHLAHPLGIAGYQNRRVKNDIRDATLLADLLRLGRLPEAWVAPPEVRELREMVRYRAKLSRLRAGLKAQVHQTLGKEGVIPQLDSIWLAGGQRWLDDLRLGDVYVDRIESLRDLIELLRPRDRPVRCSHPPPLERPSRLRSGAGLAWGRPGARRSVRRRDRRRHPVRQPEPVVFMGRADPTPPRVRHPHPARPDHQTGFASAALGRCRSGLRSLA